MRQSMIWNNPISSQGKILIEDDVLNYILGHKQDIGGLPEAGGILLGYRRGSHMHVTSATSPQPGDRQSRFRFRRCDPAHQGLALQQWKASGNMVDYLGEWHTHPVSDPTPSSLDFAEWKKIYGRKNRNMLFLIAGSDNSLWLGVGMSKNFMRATVAELDK